jgi:hypothetical protein
MRNQVRSGGEAGTTTHTSAPSAIGAMFGILPADAVVQPSLRVSPRTPSRGAFSLLTEERKLFDPIASIERSWKLDRTAPVVLLPPLLKLGQQVFLFRNPIVKGNHPPGLRSVISCHGQEMGTSPS